MSLGSVIGGVVGGVVGFFVGGPMGAIYGASAGLAIGSVIDPISPDTPQKGIPDIGTQVMLSKVGDSLFDVIGTAKITGHLIAYGKERNEPIIETTSSQSGGKGGGGSETSATTKIVGYRYYMTWALGICYGPVDTLFTILKEDDIIWEGTLNKPVSGGQETLVIDGLGSCTFYFGTDDQAQNSVMGEITSAALNSPLRNFCWVLLDDCYIGDFAKTPTLHFVVKKIPVCSFDPTNSIQTYDANPAHAMWYILNRLTEIDESWLDSSAFTAIASTLRSENRGISSLLDKQGSSSSYLEMILGHIDGIIRYTQGGQFYPKLMRNDYIVGSLPVVNETVMLESPTMYRNSWNESLNEVKVQYSQITTATYPPEPPPPQPPPQPVPPAIFYNGGMEILDTLTGTPAGWLGLGVDFTSFSRTNVQKHSGTYSGVVNNAVTARGFYVKNNLTTNPIIITAGTYRVTFWYNSQAYSIVDHPYVQLRFTNTKTGETGMSINKPFLGSNVWYPAFQDFHFLYDYVASDHLQFAVTISDSTFGGFGNIYFDDFSMVRL